MRRPNRTAALLIAAVSLSSTACDRDATLASTTSEEAALQSATTPPLTSQFEEFTDRLYLGHVQLADLVSFAEPLLLLDRVNPLPDSRGSTVYGLQLEDREKLTAELVVLAPTEDAAQDYQLKLKGPASSGLLQSHATYRGLTIAFGFDAEGEPYYGMAVVRDRMKENEDTLRAYQGLAAAPVGGVYRLGRDASESYWRPITLRAEFDPERGEENWFWEYGHRGPVTTGDLSALRRLEHSLP